MVEKKSKHLSLDIYKKLHSSNIVLFICDIFIYVTLEVFILQVDMLYNQSRHF